MIEPPNINTDRKIEPLKSPKYVLYSKDFPYTKFFNNLNDLDLDIKCNATTDAAKILFLKFYCPLVGITNNLDELDDGDAVFIDNTIEVNQDFIDKTLNKKLLVFTDFKDFRFYPVIKEIDVKISFSEEDKKERRLNVDIIHSGI